jgi:hypothetical protein
MCLCFGGEDLDSFVFKNARQVSSVFRQVVVFSTSLVNVGSKVT